MENYYGRDNLKNSFDDINDFEDEDEMMYYQGINYDRRFNNNFLPKFNYRYDLSNNYLEYSIYDKFEVEINNTSVLSQNTNNIRETTLITCNNQNKTRIILKAKEMD